LPPLAAAAAAIASAFTVSAVVGSVITAALSVGASLLIGAVAQALTPQPGLKSTLSVSISANDPRRVIIGRAATAGQLVTFQTWPTTGSSVNKNIVLLFRLADHPCQGLAPQINITGDLSNGSALITSVSSTAGIVVGMPIVSFASGERFPPGTFVAAIPGANQILMSNEATIDLPAATIVVNAGIYWSGNPVQLGARAGSDPTSVPQFFADGQDNCFVKFFDGDWNQAANPAMVAESGGRWTANSRGRGICYVEVSAVANIKAFPNGVDELFQFVFVVDGIALYDPRQDSTQGGDGDQLFDDTTTWTLNSNSAVVAYNMMLGIRAENTEQPVGSRQSDTFFGLNLPQSVLPFTENAAAMNACDVPVPLNAGGTEPTYRCNGVIAPNTGDTFETALGDVMATMGAKLVQSPTRFFFLPAVAQTPVATFTDADFRLDGPYKFTNDIPLDTVTNAVVGQFSDPASMFTGQPLPPRISPADAIADGGTKYLTLDLSFCTSETQGQRLQEIARRRARLGQTAQWALAPENLNLEAGDWITWTSARYGFSNSFEITQNDGKGSADEEQMMMVVLDVAQTDASVFAWDPAVDELSRQAPAFLPSADPVTVNVTTLVASADTITAGGTVTAALLITTDPLTDPTVVGIEFQWWVSGKPPGAAQVFTKTFAVNPAVAAGTQSYSVTEGVVSGFQYQVQAAAIRNPPMDLVFAGPVETGTPTTAAAPAASAMTAIDVTTATEALGAPPAITWYVDVTNSLGGPIVIRLPAAPLLNQVVKITDIAGTAAEFPIGVETSAGAALTPLAVIEVSFGFRQVRWNGSAWVQG
jgi:Putative phage tail protein